MRFKKTIAAGVIAASSTAYYMQPTEFKAYINGSDNVGHDQEIASLVDSDTKLGLYCDGVGLIEADQGDVVFSARADSVKCKYSNPALLSIPIVGGGNYAEHFSAERDPLRVFVSNGFAYGQEVDYFIDEPNLGDAFAAMANILIRVNEARSEAGLSLYDTPAIKSVLDASSDAERVIGGKYYGRLVDEQRAIELATAPESTPILKPDIVPVVTYLLLE